MSGGYGVGQPPTELAPLIEELEEIGRRLDTLERPSGEAVALAVAQLAGRGTATAGSPVLTAPGTLTGTVGLTYGAPTASLDLFIPEATDGVCLVTLGGMIDITDEWNGGNGWTQGLIGLAVDGVKPTHAIDALWHLIYSPPAAGGFASSSVGASRTIQRTFTPGTTVNLATVPGWAHSGASNGTLSIFNYSLIVQIVS